MSGTMGANLAVERIIAETISGCSTVLLRGRNSAVSTTPETVWTPGATYAQLTTAVTMEAVSSSANDAAAGTGARTILVDGLNNSYVRTTETVTLNGVTPVALVNTYLAINKVTVVTAGSGGTNAGNIDVRVVAGSVIKNRIASSSDAVGQSSSFFYTIPADSVGIMKSVTWGISGGTGAVSAYLLTFSSTGVSQVVAHGISGLSNTSISRSTGLVDTGAGILIPASTLLELRVYTSAGAGELVASGQLILIKKGSTNGLGF